MFVGEPLRQLVEPADDAVMDQLLAALTDPAVITVLGTALVAVVHVVITIRRDISAAALPRNAEGVSPAVPTLSSQS